MVELDWSPVKPTENGLYWWCNGYNTDVYLVSVGDIMQCYLGGWANFVSVGGYWAKCQVPAPFIVPTIPELKFDKIYFCNGKCHKEKRFLFKMGDNYLAISETGRLIGTELWVNRLMHNENLVPIK